MVRGRARRNKYEAFIIIAVLERTSTSCADAESYAIYEVPVVTKALAHSLRTGGEGVDHTTDDTGTSMYVRIPLTAGWLLHKLPSKIG